MNGESLPSVDETCPKCQDKHPRVIDGDCSAVVFECTKCGNKYTRFIDYDGE